MTVAELINILNTVEDKEKEVMLFDGMKSSSENPVFVEITDAYFNNYTDAFLIF